MDRRLHRSNGKVAHVSLRGEAGAEKFTSGDWMQIVATSAPILASPEGPRERELLFGEEFCVLDTQNNYAFGFAKRDGFCGYVLSEFLCSASPATHVVSVRQTYKKDSPDLKKWERHWPLSFGSRVLRTGEENGWAQIAVPVTLDRTVDFYVPEAHLQPVEHTAKDPATIAALFLGAPYLWGGNTAFGIDCSGLVQAALLACHIDCPGDSDQQEQALGRSVDENDSFERGDIIFWKRHEAMVLDNARLIHANAYHMAVTVEPIMSTIKRIAEQGGGPVTSRKRI